jgi:hypothetical protein
MATTNDYPANQAFPPPSNPPQALPTPREVEVEDQAARPPSFGMGSAAPYATEVDLDLQVVARPNAKDVIVTDGGNFQTNNTPDDTLNCWIINTFSEQAGTYAETLTMILARPGSLTEPVNLYSLGIDITGTEVVFSKGGQGRRIINWGKTYIVVAKYRGSLELPPVSGDSFARILNVRDGSAPTFDFYDRPLEVLAQATPVAARTVPATGPNFQGNFVAGAGVVVPFIGSGVRVPRLQGTYQVANEPPPGNGLPVNVFI